MSKTSYMDPTRTTQCTHRPKVLRTLAGVLLAGLLAASAQAADPAELTAVWKRLYGGPPRGQTQHTVTGAGGTFYLPVMTFLAGEPEQAAAEPDGRESVWTIDPATGERGPEGPALRFPEENVPFDPDFSHIRDMAALPGGDRLLLVGRLGLGRWRLIRRTATDETVYEKWLWKDPQGTAQRLQHASEGVGEPLSTDAQKALLKDLQEAQRHQLFRILPVSDGEFLLLGLRADAAEGRNEPYVVRVTADGERVWDRSYDFEFRGEPRGASTAGGRVVLTGDTTGPPGSESDELHVGVFVIDAEGEVVRRTTFPGVSPSVCITESGRLTVAAVRRQDELVTCFARGLDPDSLEQVWETPPLMHDEWLLSRPAVVTVPGGFAVATSSLKALTVARCGDDGTVRAVGRWGDGLLRASLRGATLARQGGTLAAFWTVYGPPRADGDRSQQVGGVGFKLAGERD